MSPTLSDPAELPVPADRISVVIVNFNAGDYLRRAVASVRAEAGPAAEIVVVDNASRDQSLATLPQDPGLRVLRQAENLGFAAACNIGIQATRHEFPIASCSPAHWRHW